MKDATKAASPSVPFADEEGREPPEIGVSLLLTEGEGSLELIYPHYVRRAFARGYDVVAPIVCDTHMASPS